MDTIIGQSPALDFGLQPSPVPSPLEVRPRVNISVRVGTLADVAFMDKLQKPTTKQVGWMRTKQFEGKVAAGHVLVAEVEKYEDGGWKMEDGKNESPSPSSILHPPSSLSVPVGYLIAQDQYFKRDDVGIIYQMNIAPEYRRSLVAATLLKAQFERSAYGCKLYSCWCAQDIEANKFWEAMGFVALAFRSGSRTKGKKGSPRVHIFWQKRIRQGDETTPWWFPSKTAGGALNEDRIVLPIPPGTHWSDAKPIVLPEDGDRGLRNSDGELKALEVEPLARKRRMSSDNPKSVFGNPQSRETQFVEKRGTMDIARCGFRFGEVAPAPQAAVEKPKPEPKPKVKRKNDPQLVAAARELRDRWLEHVNKTPLIGQAKYDVTRMMTGNEQGGQAARSLIDERRTIAA